MKSVGLYTLGCKVSQYETEAIAEKFERAGYAVRAFGDDNDVYVINTCTVTAESDRKSRQIIRRAKRKNPNSVVVVCGCYSQRSPDEVSAISDVDATVGSANKLSIIEIAEELLRKRAAGDRGKIINVTDIDGEPFEAMTISRGPRTRVYVKIEDGCECRCTYCAIPSARGLVRSKPKEDIIREVEALAKSGVSEIVLTGIETGSYGADFDEDYRLSDLLAELDARKSAPRIRLGSLAPELVGERFVEKIKNLKILAPHFHLSVQSGSDNVLRGMKRRYNRKTALENINRIKANIQGATFTTDLMVGFPGESDSDFMETVSFVREAGFLDCHVFAYSKRKNTPAADYENQIPEEIKRRRSEMLISVAEQTRNEVLSEIVQRGEPLSCVFETEKAGTWTCHSEGFAEVLVEADEGAELHGLILDVIPQRVCGGAIIGKLL